MTDQSRLEMLEQIKKEVLRRDLRVSAKNANYVVQVFHVFLDETFITYSTYYSKFSYQKT